MSLVMFVCLFCLSDIFFVFGHVASFKYIYVYVGSQKAMGLRPERSRSSGKNMLQCGRHHQHSRISSESQRITQSNAQCTKQD